ncbi:MAG: DUF3530 family protein [Pseudomonadota bacterium]
MRSEQILPVLLCGLLTTFAAGAWAQEDEEGQDAQQEQGAQDPPRQRPVSLTGLGEWALARQYPEQAVWLNLEDDSRTLALFSPELKTPVRSAVIVLADEGQTADQSILGALRQSLSEVGMAVMTLGLEAPPRVFRDSRLAREVPTPGEQENGEPEADDPARAGQDSVMIDVAAGEDLEQLAEEYREGVRAVLNAAAAELNDRGYQQLLVLGVGWSADYVTEWAASREELLGAIWLAPKFSPQRLDALAEMLAAERNWWLMDLHDSGGELAKQGRERGAQFARAEVGRYQRQPLPLASPPRRDDAARVANRISARVDR